MHCADGRVHLIGGEMANYRYTTVFGKIEGLLEKVRSTGVPAKANATWLKSLGYTSSNDKSLPPVLKSLGFIDSANVPIQRWRDYRGVNHRRVLGEALREAYADLFALYHDGCSRSDSELESFFRTQTDGGEQVVKKLVGTFKALCANADTGEHGSLGAERASGSTGQSQSGGAVGSPQAPAGAAAPSLHIDVQIHISPESSAEQVDQIFKSMAKHLYKSGDH